MTRRVSALSAAAAAMLLLSSCAALPLDRNEIGTVRAAAGAARETARLSLAEANDLARGLALDRKVESASTNLAEDDFPYAIARSDADAWMAAFGAIDAYLGALQGLLNPGRAADAGDAIAELGDELRGGSINARVPAGVQGLFAGLGAALVEAHGAARARDIMLRADPAFRAVVAGMADAIGETADADLRGTVHANWQTDIQRIQFEFKQVPPADKARRRAVAKAYLAAIDARDAQDADLVKLADSLVALGEAHAAAARGEAASARYWFDRIDSLLDDVRARTITAAAKENGQ